MPEKILKATHTGELVIGEIIVPCHVLNNANKDRVISGRGMQNCLGFSKVSSGLALTNFVSSKLAHFLPEETLSKLSKPIKFQRIGSGGSAPETYANYATILIDISDAIIQANRAGLLSEHQQKHAIRAEIIIVSVAKVGIIALVDEATGYIEDKEKFEYRELFKEFIREQAAQYEKQFPDEFYDIFYKIYGYPRSAKKNQHPPFFAKLTRKYIYEPLAGSNGVILEMLDEKNPVLVTISGAKKRKYKLFQFLEKIGKDSLQQHMWQLIGIGKASPNKTIFKRNFNRTFSKHFQKEMFGE